MGVGLQRRGVGPPRMEVGLPRLGSGFSRPPVSLRPQPRLAGPHRLAGRPGQFCFGRNGRQPTDSRPTPCLLKARLPPPRRATRRAARRCASRRSRQHPESLPPLLLLLPLHAVSGATVWHKAPLPARATWRCGRRALRTPRRSYRAGGARPPPPREERRWMQRARVGAWATDSALLSAGPARRLLRSNRRGPRPTCHPRVPRSCRSAWRKPSRPAPPTRRGRPPAPPLGRRRRAHQTRRRAEAYRSPRPPTGRGATAGE
mmetsp:Transcript_11566/g.37051  ORF Transcript_11566/g.37051 Transcript_11566/m.37051 type:complete len:260 (+) Transcript_11566:101-880(+)